MKQVLKAQTVLSTDTGRSMVEMLGTLAIIGVLSIAGIAGYRYALTKYKANETMDELNKRAVVYATQVLQNALAADTVLSNGEFGDKTTLGYDVEAVVSSYESEFKIALSNYPSEVCRDILKNYTIPLEIIIGNTRYNRDSDNVTICGEESAPETVFVYAADLGENAYEATGDSYEDASYEKTTTGEEGCVPPQVYHEGQGMCVTPCETNSDCGIGSGKYCKLDFNIGGFESSCREAPPYGTCESASGTPVTVTDVGRYQKSSSPMNWWSAQNYCEAIGRMATVADFGCADEADISRSWGYCNAVAGNSKSSSQTKSDAMIEFQTAFGKSNYYWTSDSYSACYAYYVGLRNGAVDSDGRSDTNYALCRVGRVGD